MFQKFGMVGLLTLALSLAMSNEARAANRIEGSVTFASGGRYGFALNATVEVVDYYSGRVVDRRSTDGRGAYTAFSPAGRYFVRASYRYNGRTLTGRNCCVDFRTTVGRVQGFNILVQ